MRMLLPDVKLRRRIRELPSTLYNDCQYPDFNEALRLFAEFYKVAVPAVEWYEYLDDRKTLGLTWYEGVNGKLELSHPENWRKMKASPGKPFCPTCACWVGTLLHEFYHVLHFVEEETKADRYAGQFVTGL